MTDFFWRKLDLTKLIYNIVIVYSSGDLVRYPVRDAGLRLPSPAEDNNTGRLLVPDEYKRGEPPCPRPSHIKATGLQVCC